MYPTAAELLPTWWRVVCVVLLVGVVAVLGARAARVPGPARWWHTAYAVMAVGMIVMYALNPMDTPGFNGPALLVFVVALLGVIALAVATVRVGHDPGTSVAAWVVAVVDAVTLAYIQIPADVRPVIVCVLFACYLAVQVVLRLTVAVRALRGADQSATRTLVDPSGRPAAGGVSAGGPGGEAGPSLPARRRVDAAVPVALAVLALTMLYMLSV